MTSHYLLGTVVIYVIRRDMIEFLAAGMRLRAVRDKGQQAHERRLMTWFKAEESLNVESQSHESLWARRLYTVGPIHNLCPLDCPQPGSPRLTKVPRMATRLRGYDDSGSVLQTLLFSELGEGVARSAAQSPWSWYLGTGPGIKSPVHRHIDQWSDGLSSHELDFPVKTQPFREFPTNQPQ